jgi:hypothetical protein
MVDSEKMSRLQKMIETSGGPDKYIDAEEEREIFEHGSSLGIARETVEAVLNHYCRDRDWTREQEILCDLRDTLDEATRDDGAIDRGEFEHCVNYAVSMNMPRKRATELAVRYVSDHHLKIKKKLLQGDWFAPIRDQYGR